MLHTTTPSVWVRSGRWCPPKPREGRGIQPPSLRPPNQPHGPKASSIPVGCSLAAALPYSDVDLFTGQSKYTLEPARSESPLMMLAGDQIMRAGGSVLPSICPRSHQLPVDG